MKEREYKRLCELSGMSYRPRVIRVYHKISKYIGDWIYYTHHISVGYLIWVGVKLKLVPFSTLELWCFCRKDRKDRKDRK